MINITIRCTLNLEKTTDIRKIHVDGMQFFVFLLKNLNEKNMKKLFTIALSLFLKIS